MSRMQPCSGPGMLTRSSLVLVLLTALVSLSSGCATARLVGPPPPVLPSRVPSVNLVIEPFFENSKWKVETQAQTATVSPGYGLGGLGGLGGYGGYGGYGYGGYGPFAGQDVTVYQDVAVKPVFSRSQVLATEQAQVIAEIQRLRPSWRVYSTAALGAGVPGPVTLVRTVVGESSVLTSDRTLKGLCFGFGFVLPPLFLVEIDPVHEQQRVQGLLQRYDAEGLVLKGKLLRYASQPDFAVDTRGLPQRAHPFALDIDYDEGLFASEVSREPVIVHGFTVRLATAIVAMVEGL